MYSRRGENPFGPGWESYLTICYSMDVETKIKNEIEANLREVFEVKQNCTFVAHYVSPQIDESNEEETAPYLKYINDRNYWNIFNIKFELKGGSSGEHNTFWNILTETLSKL